MEDLGLIVDLGHGGKACPNKNPLHAPSRLVVIASNGIHRISANWCSCSQSIGKASEKMIQLMRLRWFPASPQRPATVVSFECLELFHKITVQGKLTGYNFYQSLMHLTDNTDINPPRVRDRLSCLLLAHSNISLQRRYEEFMRVCRLWRHLKLLKRSGVCLSPGGINEAGPGCCAITCPACPNPEIAPRPARSYDPGVYDDGRDKRYVLILIYEGRRADSLAYSFLDKLMVMLDANFRLKSKDRDIKSDPALGSGYAYYVEENDYQAYLKTCPEQTEVSLMSFLLCNSIR